MKVLDGLKANLLVHEYVCLVEWLTSELWMHVIVEHYECGVLCFIWWKVSTDRQACDLRWWSQISGLSCPDACVTGTENRMVYCYVQTLNMKS